MECFSHKTIKKTNKECFYDERMSVASRYIKHHAVRYKIIADAHCITDVKFFLLFSHPSPCPIQMFELNPVTRPLDRSTWSVLSHDAVQSQCNSARLDKSRTVWHPPILDIAELVHFIFFPFHHMINHKLTLELLSWM